MKIIFTVVTAEWQQHPLLTDCIRETWGKDNPDVYYLWGNDHKNIKPGDWVWYKQEGYGAMLWKLIDFLTWYDGDYDYVMKTNTGAYIDMPALCKWLENKPRAGFYAGNIGHYVDSPYNTISIDFVSGAGIILSKDLVDMMIGVGRKEFGFKYIDDIAIGLFMHNHNVKPVQGQRESNINIPSYHYYLRASDGQRQKDVDTMKILYGRRAVI